MKTPVASRILWEKRAQARALRDSKLQQSNGGKKRYGVSLISKGLPFRSLKVSGPSPGVGHRYNNLQTFRSVQHSGPSSPGEGHK
ncbi:hypothetical protein CCACVL1_17030 [Corchorus capsularis]|uniref:Uncharacterized protein n=1 Tax=Corchorus capsularis TaxID=210143 RepID=A0A1R3HUM0_COCAP|nr:hypothetical protein CCACVL1_17030 [Corchorus capsularis]